MEIIKPREQLSRRLNSGERQVSENLDGIEHWHKWRYHKVLDHIKDGDKVIDLGCGCGYGTYILSGAAELVLGIDDSQEAMQFANKHYKTANNRFDNKSIFDAEGIFDVVVAFEILEHIQKTEKFFELVKRITKRNLILSTPHDTLDTKTYPFHYKHYSEQEIEQLVRNAGFEIIELQTPTFANGLAVFCVAKKVQ